LDVKLKYSLLLVGLLCLAVTLSWHTIIVFGSFYEGLNYYVFLATIVISAMFVEVKRGKI